jgi:hypothetical protein
MYNRLYFGGTVMKNNLFGEKVSYEHFAPPYVLIALMSRFVNRYQSAANAVFKELSWQQMFLASVPALIQSVPANIVNYTIGADYMFFKGDSAFLPAIFGGVSDGMTTVIIYLLYIFLPAAFYLPSFLSQRKNRLRAKVN